MTHLTADRKAELLARIARHEAADTIAQGHYAQMIDGRLSVCAVGCAMVEPGDDPPSPRFHDWHEAMEDRWGISAWLGELEDEVFENLEGDEAATWPRRFVESIPVDVELGDRLARRLAVRRLRETVLPLAPVWPESARNLVEPAVVGMIDALENDGDLESARKAAWSTVDLVRESVSALESTYSAAHSASSQPNAASSAARAVEEGAWENPDPKITFTSRTGSMAWTNESQRIIDTLTSDPSTW